MIADLHMHSRYSDDGDYSPEELVNKCKEAGIVCMAIADHNCVSAVKEGRTAAKQAGIRFIPAIEIDCVWREKIFHLLGYGIREEDPFYRKLETDVDDQSREASRMLLRKMQDMGFRVDAADMEELAGNYYRPWVWTPEMFGEVLLKKKEHLEDPKLAPYRKGGSRSDNPYVNFYWDFCSEGKPCFVPMCWPDMTGIIRELHQRGAEAVLAHPGAHLRGQETLIGEMFQEMDLDGIEVMSSYHSQDQVDFFYGAARRFGKYITCGSDFHGKTKPSIRLGEMLLPTGVSREKIEQEILEKWNNYPEQKSFLTGREFV